MKGEAMPSGEDRYFGSTEQHPKNRFTFWYFVKKTTFAT